ncbi:hypothetical protein C8J57DRAFT_1234920 [Mycena rebaudengoi]|nr:hypothetical protein C8J57DRAFT_1234920 [Mycena rebaudengoi]
MANNIPPAVLAPSKSISTPQTPQPLSSRPYSTPTDAHLAGLAAPPSLAPSNPFRECSLLKAIAYRKRIEKVPWSYMPGVLYGIRMLDEEDVQRVSRTVIPPQLLPSSEFTTTLCNSDRVMALRACLLVFTVTRGNIIPDDLQLQAGLAAATGKESFVIARTGWGKTLHSHSYLARSSQDHNHYITIETTTTDAGLGLSSYERSVTGLGCGTDTATLRQSFLAVTEFHGSYFQIPAISPRDMSPLL